MVSSRLGLDKKSLSPSEMAVGALRQCRKADEMLDKMRSQLELFDKPDTGTGRLSAVEPEGAKLILAGLKAGAFGDPPVDADTPAKAILQAGALGSLKASLAVNYLIAAADVARHGGITFRPTFRRAILSATAASKLGPHLDMPELTCYAMGLLQDVGVLALAALHQNAYSMVAETAEQSGMDLTESERTAFRIDHTQAGLAVLIYRGFPPMVCEAAAFHHGHPERISRSARVAAASTMLADSGEEFDARMAAADCVGLPFGAIDTVVSELRIAQHGLTALLG